MYKIYKEQIEIKNPGELRARSDEFLRRSLGEFLGCEPGSFEIVRSASGKPFLDSVKSGLSNDKRVSFNLSHSHSYFALACSESHDIGLDVQVHVPFNPKVFERICTDEELSAIERPNEEIFYKIWTIKEAAMKCIGTGFQFSPKNLKIDFDSSQVLFLKPPPQDFLFVKECSKLKFEKLDLFAGCSSHIVWAV